MSSGYALPVDHVHEHKHQHSHLHLASHSSAHISPYQSNDATSSAFFQARADANLFTHQETDREHSPSHHHETDLRSNDPGSIDRKQPIDQDRSGTATFPRSVQHLDDHTHTHTPSRGSMKSTLNMIRGRARGESDLGRPMAPSNASIGPGIPADLKSWFSLPEALTALLVPLPYLLSSAAFASTHGHGADIQFYPLPAYASVQHDASSHSNIMLSPIRATRGSSLLDAATLTSGTLILVGVIARSISAVRTLDRRKDLSVMPQQFMGLLTISSAQSMAVRTLSLGLPLYAAMELGGLRVGLVLLLSIAVNITCVDNAGERSVPSWKQELTSKAISAAVLGASMLFDFAGWTSHASYSNLLTGYLALLCSVILLHPPLPTFGATMRAHTASKDMRPVAAVSPWSFSAASPLTSSINDQNSTLLAGLLSLCITVAMSMLFSIPVFVSGSPMVLSLLAISTMSCSILFSSPSSLRSQHKAGMAMACLFSASIAFLFSPALWPGTITNGGLSALSFVGALYDTNGLQVQRSHNEHIHEHKHDTHTHNDGDHQHEHTEPYSKFTKSLLAYFKPGSLAHGILSEKDSRRIAYFTALNFGFMLVQGVYGYLSGSLGLLSDTVHMFFDCLGLVVGLGAAVASKWPNSPDKPYGWGKLNTLAGFGNGVFLMLVSLEFVWEAIEGIMEGQELRHVKELMVVTVLGFIVNMIGLFAFGHAHAGHDHGHDHGHSHGHSHDHSHDANGHVHSHDCDHKPVPPVTAGHDHHNENMHGLFLHVAADAGGSLAVIISTALTLWKPWYLWDPLATIIIAILIFAMAIPLVKSSGQKLLLVIPDDLEYMIKNTLQELSELRGVVGYTVPRFWIDDKEDAAEGHGHHHHHHHDHNHNHDHSHHDHDHAHSHAHAHSHDHAHQPEPKKGVHGKKVKGVIHILAAPAADLEDIRVRVEDFVHERGMDLVIQVEHESDGRCWCRGVEQM